MELLRGVVERLTYHNEETGYTVAKLSPEHASRFGMGESREITVVGNMVGVNVGVPVPREPFSFGGWNESKFGVGDITGKSSIEFWTRLKKSTVKWNPEAGINWMS